MTMSSQQAIASMDRSIATMQNVATEARRLNPDNRSFMEVLLAPIQPKSFDDPHEKVMHQGNWPWWAEFAAVIVQRDRDFPTAKEEKTIRYYQNTAEIEADLSEIRQESHDGDWSIECSATIYSWDLGPQLMERRSVC